MENIFYNYYYIILKGRVDPGHVCHLHYFLRAEMSYKKVEITELLDFIQQIPKLIEDMYNQ